MEFVIRTVPEPHGRTHARVHARWPASRLSLPSVPCCFSRFSSGRRPSFSNSARSVSAPGIGRGQQLFAVENRVGAGKKTQCLKMVRHLLAPGRQAHERGRQHDARDRDGAHKLNRGRARHRRRVRKRYRADRISQVFNWLRTFRRPRLTRGRSHPHFVGPLLPARRRIPKRRPWDPHEHIDWGRLRRRVERRKFGEETRRGRGATRPCP